MKKIIVTLAVCLLVFAGVCELRAQSQEVPALTSAQYASMDKNDIFVIMFTITGCKPCARARLSLMPTLYQKYAQEGNVHVFTFLVDNAQDVPPAGKKRLNEELHISSGPTFVVLHEGAEKYRYEGFAPNLAPRLEQEISAAVAREQ